MKVAAEGGCVVCKGRSAKSGRQLQPHALTCSPKCTRENRADLRRAASRRYMRRRRAAGKPGSRILPTSSKGAHHEVIAEAVEEVSLQDGLVDFVQV